MRVVRHHALREEGGGETAFWLNGQTRVLTDADADAAAAGAQVVLDCSVRARKPRQHSPGTVHPAPVRWAVPPCEHKR